MLSVKNPDKEYCSLSKEQTPRHVEVFYSWSIINLSRILGKLNGLLLRVLKLFGVKLHTNVFTNIFGIPDIFIGWIPLSSLKGIEIIEKHEIDIIYVSSKPFSSALIGVFIKRFTQKPLVLDLRDPTIISLYNQYSLTYRFHTKITKTIEKFVLRHVDKLLFVTKTTEKKYLLEYPFLNGKTSHIYNGFFGEHYPTGDIKPYNKFTITYVGNYYTKYYGSELLFQALKIIVMREMIPKNSIKFLYLGTNTNWFNHIREKYDLFDIIDCPGKVSRQESILSLFKSSVIYLRIVEDRISTKLYEGLFTGNPLLSAISNKEVIEIIEKYSPQSINVSPNDSDALAEAIQILYENWKQGQLCRKVSNKFLNHFNKKALTKEFVSVLDSLIQHQKNGCK